MVDLVVEDGTGKSDANSYNELEDIGARLVGTPMAAVWEPLDEEIKKSMAIYATQAIDTLWRHFGQTKTETQALQWPRTKNYDSSGRIIMPGTIPEELKKAHAILAGTYSAYPDILDEAYQGQTPIKSFSIEGLSVSFGDATSKNSKEGAAEEQILGPRFVQVELILSPIAVRKDAGFLTSTQMTQVRG